MLAVTDAVELAWKVAADEASQSVRPSIEPLHLLIGICSAGKFLEPDVVHRRTLNASALGAINLECKRIAAILVELGMDPVTLRRAARKVLGRTEPAGPKPMKLNRSEGSHRIFDRAAQIAQQRKGEEISLIDLLTAVLNSDDEPLCNLLTANGVSAIEFNRLMQLTSERQSQMGSPIAIEAEDSTGEERLSRKSQGEDLTQISLIVDASQDPIADSSNQLRNTQRLALFYDLSLQFGLEVDHSALLNKILTRVVEVVPGADRAGLIVRDRKDDSLRLQAHMPAGRPAVSTTLAERAMREQQGFIWTRSGEDQTPSLAAQRSEAGMYAPLLWRGSALGVMCVDNCHDFTSFGEDDLRFFVAIAHHAAMAIANHHLQEDLRQRSILLERMLTNFSPRVRQKLLEKAAKGRLALGGEKSEVTILFSDIRGFTRMSAAMDAEEISEMLNDYFSVLVETLFRHDGTIDKFVGDSILAVFGSPEADSGQYEKAVRAALEMQSAMSALNKLRTASGRVTCQIGIGVHCGEVLHGFIGSADRMEFTVVGDPVNRAARYCAGSQAGEVLISAELHQRVWRCVEVEACTITTKHEGDFSAFRLKSVKPSS